MIRQGRTHEFFDIIEWLSGDECHDLAEAGLASGLGRRLRAAGLPVDRLVLHLRMLHSELVGRAVTWAPDGGVSVYHRRHGYLDSEMFAGSPVRRVMEAGKPEVVHYSDNGNAAWMHSDVFQGRQLVECFIVSLGNREGSSAVSFCTASPRGFSAAERAFLKRIVPALRNVCELNILRDVEQRLLDTYIGSSTARRILAGNVRRGHAETLEVALLLCDLRGFTELSNSLPSARILQLLDVYFDRVVPAITRMGGEVLKFMGDSVLAFFHGDSAEAAAAVAVEAAVVALRRLARVRLPDADLRAGIALHYGKVSYGNIGSGNRLDFTLIGPDVNLVSRIQAACNSTGQSLLMSERFAGLLDRTQTLPVGQHRLRGFAAPAQLYTLHDPHRILRLRPAVRPATLTCHAKV